MSNRRRVLVVDDEAGIQLALEGILDIEGFDVKLASNGQEALDVMSTWKPDVILLDLMMPVMSGSAFREKQLTLPNGLDSVPLVILSGTRDARVRAESMGAAAAISKPFDVDEVVHTLRRVIDRRG